MASGHARKRSDRVIVRRSTKGPLDAPDDPLFQPESPAAQDLLLPTADPSGFLQRSVSPNTAAVSEIPVKDLAFLLEQSIYHPVSQLEIPAPFRVPFPSIGRENDIEFHLTQLDKLLSAGHFLQAAYFSALILTSGKVKSTDLHTIFRLLQIRFSCLELTGNTGLAAQEAKALEDLNSAFYFSTSSEGVDEHIMPYSLRLQALRLQSLGFSDPRRGVSSLYDLGLECRERIALASTSDEERDLWRDRLRDIGVRVVNALVEMDDLETARRTLISQLPKGDAEEDELSPEMLSKTVLLFIKIGDTGSAAELLEKYSCKDSGMMQALMCVGEGRWEDAVESWQKLLESPNSSADQTVSKQNLAVALLYVGRLPEAKKMMEDLVQAGHGFQSLTFNLATLYELSIANPFGSKRQLAERVAQQSGGPDRNWGRANTDFKL